LSRHFRIELEWVNADGTPAALQKDVESRPRRQRWLRNLTDDFLIEAIPMGWPRGPAGNWIMGPLGDDYLVGQFDRGESALWYVPGAQPGLLTVLRIIAKDELRDVLDRGQP